MSNPAGRGGVAATIASAKPSSATPPVPLGPIQDATLTDADVEALVGLSESLRYDGFNTKTIRNVARRTMTGAELCMLLVAAAHIGNNPTRLNTKIKDKDVAKMIKDMITSKKLKSAGSRSLSAEDLTLARLTTAFAPLYYQIRLKVSDTLQSQPFRTTLAVQWQSPSFAMYSRDNVELQAWLLQFGMAIKPKSEDVEITKGRTESFRLLAISNMSSDSYLNSDNLNLSVKELLRLAYTA
jgi:hypothetical protein